jgi:2',3'-cyclic-nucleotide 2'-phosphodiesterase (5'-nucleotidase family)
MNAYKKVLIFTLFIFFGCTPKNYLVKSDVSHYRIDGEDDPIPSARIDSIIRPYREQLSEVMDEVVGESVVLMEKALPAGGLNNWFGDALLNSGSKLFDREVDVAIQNFGGLRVNSIGSGPVTRGKIYELMPFDNLTTLVVLDSARIQAICDNLARYGGGVVSSTLKFGILEDRAYMIEIHGLPLSDGKMYNFIFPDYVVNGGSIGKIVSGAEREDSAVLIRDVLLMELERLKGAGAKMEGRPDGRIYFVND